MRKRGTGLLWNDDKMRERDTYRQTDRQGDKDERNREEVR